MGELGLFRARLTVVSEASPAPRVVEEAPSRTTKASIPSYGAHR